MNSKTFFLTYPQSDINPNDFLLFAQTKGNLIEYVIGREHHADGRPHLHAALKFSTAIRGTMRLWDYEGRHPNVQSPRNFAACKQYCKKEENYIENPIEEQEVQPETHLGELCKTYEQEVDWFSYCAQNKIGFQYAKYFWDTIHLDTVTLGPNDNIEGQICEPLSTYRWNPEQYPVLSVVGRAGCGKTTWAKQHAPKPALFVSHIDQLRLFKPNFHKSIIFDDMDIKHWPRTSQIHLLDYDNPRAIHLRHVVATIPAGTIKIFTSNNDIVDLSDPAIRRRIYKITVRENGLTGE